MATIQVSTVSSANGLNATELGSEAQQMIAQLQAAFQTGNPTVIQAASQSAMSLLDQLNDAHDTLSGQLSNGPLSASTASALSEKLDAIDADATDLEAALQSLGQGGIAPPPRNMRAANNNGPANANTNNLGLPSNDDDAGANALSMTSTPTTDAAGNLPTGQQILTLLNGNPTVLTSLKALVKTSQQESILDAIGRALQSGGGGMSTNGSGASGGAQANANSATGPQGKAVNTAVPEAVTEGATLEGGFTTGTTSTGQPTVSSNIQLTAGGAQAGNGNTASIDGWTLNLGLSNPGDIDEFLMMVLLACYEDGQKGLEGMAQQLQKTNNAKKALRAQLSGLYAQTTGNPTTDAAVDAQIQNVQGQLSDASDDAQLQQLQLQNATQNQQELLQEISAFSKDLYDSSMNILRKIGG